MIRIIITLIFFITFKAITAFIITTTIIIFIIKVKKPEKISFKWIKTNKKALNIKELLSNKRK